MRNSSGCVEEVFTCLRVYVCVRVMVCDMYDADACEMSYGIMGRSSIKLTGSIGLRQLEAKLYIQSLSSRGPRPSARDGANETPIPHHCTTQQTNAHGCAHRIHSVCTLPSSGRRHCIIAPSNRDLQPDDTEQRRIAFWTNSERSKKKMRSHSPAADWSQGCCSVTYTAYPRAMHHRSQAHSTLPDSSPSASVATQAKPPVRRRAGPNAFFGGRPFLH
jgi:hypothetical protein